MKENAVEFYQNDEQNLTTKELTFYDFFFLPLTYVFE